MFALTVALLIIVLLEMIPPCHTLQVEYARVAGRNAIL